MSAVEIFLLVFIAHHEIGNRVILLENRVIVKDLTSRNEKLILDFMSRTVDRWDKLQSDNPDVRVPKIVEPNDKPHLTPKEMERP